MAITACGDPAQIIVTKTIVTGAFNCTNAKEITAAAGDDITFAIEVKNTGGASATVTVADVFPPQFTDITWTRTAPLGAVSTGAGNIVDSDVVIAAGKSLTFLVETTYEPGPCDSLSVNVVTVTPAPAACCGQGAISDWAKVRNAEGPRPKLDPTEGWTAMEVLLYLLEGVDLPNRAVIANFINNGCGTLATLINATAGAGDGIATPILDAFGQPTGLFAETTTGF